MYQHVRRRCAGSSQRGNRKTGVSLRVPGRGPPQLCDVVIVNNVDNASSTASIVVPRWFGDHRQVFDRDERYNGEQHNDDNDGYIYEDQQQRRRRGRCRRGHFASQKKNFSEDAREIGQSRWCPSGLRMADLRVIFRPVDNNGKRLNRRTTVCAQEARSSESLQSRSGGRCDAEPVGCNGTSSCRLQNRFYPATGSPRGWQTTHCRQNAFFSRSFSSGVQIRIHLYDKT